MNLEMIVRTMQFILAPAVMINACAVILTGLLGHYAAINNRLRDMNHERLAQLRTVSSAELEQPELEQLDPLTLERLGEIDAQLPELLLRHRLIRDGLLSVYGGMFLFIASMLVIALGAWAGMNWISVAALIVFLAGTTLVLIGVFTVALEIRRSHLAVEFEVSRVSNFSRDRRTAVASQVSNS